MILIFFVKMGYGKHQLKSLEMETWHDLAMVYMKLSQWRDAEACLLKSENIGYYNASRLHITGMLYLFSKGEIVI